MATTAMAAVLLRKKESPKIDIAAQFRGNRPRSKLHGSCFPCFIAHLIRNVDNGPRGWSNLSLALAAFGGVVRQMFQPGDFVFIIRNYELAMLPSVQNTALRDCEEQA
jgi:hypothetical protein